MSAARLPTTSDPVARIVMAAFDLAMALYSDHAEDGNPCRMCGAPAGMDAHTVNCLLAAFSECLASTGTADGPDGLLRYFILPVFREGEAEAVAKAALRLERLGRELQEAGSRLHSAMEAATVHLYREQSRRATRNRDLWAHWAVQPLYGASPLAGQGPEMLAKRRGMAKEAAG